MSSTTTTATTNQKKEYFSQWEEGRVPYLEAWVEPLY